MEKEVYFGTIKQLKENNPNPDRFKWLRGVLHGVDLMALQDDDIDAECYEEISALIDKETGDLY